MKKYGQQLGEEGIHTSNTETVSRTQRGRERKRGHGEGESALILKPIYLEIEFRAQTARKRGNNYSITFTTRRNGKASASPAKGG
ncbi:unnamed protein product [Medioppia subpectinata]|uniref:Uncharacterized protein n=1 Tax=Medioppia subpectinata TaxID=1979941 RepID=A0A7R9Q836_9ACAR|nr:unnamed protein product [Medioppia subpectinata]CAG2116466.1 unnamed protein product [Medioppia subpectinata]